MIISMHNITYDDRHLARRIPFDDLLYNIDQEVRRGFVERFDDGDLSVFNYVIPLNDICRICRGLVINMKDRIVVATPFRKFAPHIEETDMSPSQLVQCTEKYDGTLGIVFRLNEKIRVATRKGLNTPLAKEAEIWISKHIPTEFFQNGETYLFEIMFKSNLNIYEGNEEMILLSAFNESGHEYSLVDIQKLSLKWKIETRWILVRSLVSLEKDSKSITKKGYVLKSLTGMRVCFTSDGYSRMKRLVLSISPLYIWKLMYTDSFQGYVEDIPSTIYHREASVIMRFIRDRQISELDEHIESILSGDKISVADRDILTMIETMSHLKLKYAPGRGYFAELMGFARFPSGYIDVHFESLGFYMQSDQDYPLMVCRILQSELVDVIPQLYRKVLTRNEIEEGILLYLKDKLKDKEKINCLHFKWLYLENALSDDFLSSIRDLLPTELVLLLQSDEKIQFARLKNALLLINEEKIHRFVKPFGNKLRFSRRLSHGRVYVPSQTLTRAKMRYKWMDHTDVDIIVQDHTVPPHLWGYIFEFLPFPECVSIQHVCIEWYQLCKWNVPIQKRIFEHYYLMYEKLPPREGDV